MKTFKLYSLLTSKCFPWATAAELTSGSITQVSNRSASMCWGTQDFMDSHHHPPPSDGGTPPWLPSLGAMVVPCFSSIPPVSKWDWEAWERRDGDRGIGIPALSHGRSPLPGVWSSLASCPGSMPRKLGSGCTTAQPLGPSAFLSLLRPRIWVAPFITHSVHLSQGWRKADPLSKGGLRCWVLMNHLSDTWPWLISSFCGKTTELIFILVPDFKDCLCQALWIIGNKALFSSLRHVSVQSNKSHKGKKMLHFRDSFFLQS